MKRLTEYTIPETGFTVVPEEKYKRILMDEKPSVEKVYNRLKKIEDILGDEYDLDLVQKLIQAYREGRYIILKEPEQAGISRLRELAQADREGRCVVVPSDYDGEMFKIWMGQILSSRRFETNIKELGKTVFLTREEAQAALRREQG